MSAHTPERLRCEVCDMPTLGDTLCNLHYEEQEKMTHTPGPWIVKPGAAMPGYDGAPLRITANGRYIGKVDSVAGSHYQDDQNAANARLIAAAPELLEALKVAQAIINKDIDITEMDCEQIAQAIRLAEGRA